jgi:hypothetical protein
LFLALLLVTDDRGATFVNMELLTAETETGIIGGRDPEPDGDVAPMLGGRWTGPHSLRVV